MKNTRKQSNRGFLVALGAVGLLGIAALGYAMTRGGASARVTEIDPTLPKVDAVGYVVGSPTAPVEVIEWADFECPGCGQFALLTAPDVKQRLVQTGRVRYRFMDFPLPQHLNSITASLAAACANEKGRFWEMHDAIFANQHRWNTQTTDNPLPIMREIAGQIGLNGDEIGQCIESKRHLAAIQANLAEGEKRGVGSTPSFLIGGKLITGAISYDKLKAYVDSAQAQADTAK